MPTRVMPVANKSNIHGGWLGVLLIDLSMYNYVNKEVPTAVLIPKGSAVYIEKYERHDKNHHFIVSVYYKDILYCCTYNSILDIPVKLIHIREGVDRNVREIT